MEEYFRFTKWLDTRKSLDSWKKWFKGRGIKTEIRKEGQFFALFREGEEAIGEEEDKI